MTSRNDTHLLLSAFVDELARCGLREACTSPGSRSAPLVLALVRHGGLRCHSHLDERCGGFFALGAAKAGGRPVAVACTSGTAAAQLAPAVIEAWEARVPLLVLTADRPAELREVGAGQTIDQIKLYGRAAKWFFEVGTHAAGPQRLRWIRSLACRAYWTALEARPGPVHLNWPLREPLVPDGPLPEDHSGRAGGGPWLRRWAPAADAAPCARALGELAGGRPRGVVVAGRCEGRTPSGPPIAAFAAAAGFPLLADPLSGARGGAAAVAHYDLLLRHQPFARAQRPDLVIRLGDLPTSKALRQWLGDLPDACQLALDPEGSWQDPSGVVSVSAALDPASALTALAPALAQPPSGWLDTWRHADQRAGDAVDAALGDELSEPAVARELARALPAEATLVVASSMPVRDVETFWPARDEGPSIVANRGANGIDGTVSTAFGVAAVAPGPVALLIGDVALAHDIGGLLAARRLGLALTIVVINNDGGGIFEFLPVAAQADAYEEHVATPHGMDFAHAARLYGVEHRGVGDLGTLAGALSESLGAPATTLIEVRSDRGANARLHERVAAAVRAAL